MKLAPAFLFAATFAGTTFAQTGAELAAQGERLQVVLGQLKPDQWVAKGAPDTYMRQWQSTQQDLGTFIRVARDIDQHPQKLTLALDAYFRLQAIEWRFESLMTAVRTYQNPATGDVMESVLRAGAASREGLRGQITELAERQEQEFAIVNSDAQACRVELSRLPAATRRTATKSSGGSTGAKK